MFSKSVTNSGKFIKMPATSRLLYYDLGMNADDDGYAEWFTIVRMTGSTEQDLRVLEANGFVHVFDENVLVIRDWRENNYLRSDRYTPSKYLEIYGPIARLPTGIPTGNPGKDRLGKDRLGKDRIGQDTNTLPQPSASEVARDDFEEFWEAYPRKIGKGDARKAWKKIKQAVSLLPRILASVEEHKNSEQWRREGGRFIPYPATFLNQERWEDEVEAAPIMKPIVFEK